MTGVSTRDGFHPWLPGLILLAGLLGGAALVVLHVSTGFFGLFAALSVSLPYTGRRKGFTVEGRALVSEALMIQYISVATWFGALVGEVRTFAPPQRVMAVVCAILLMAYGLLLWWRPPMVTLTAEGITHRQFIRESVIPWDSVSPAVSVQGAWLTLTPGVRVSMVGLRTEAAYAGRIIDQLRADPGARPAAGGVA